MFRLAPNEGSNPSLSAKRKKVPSRDLFPFVAWGDRFGPSLFELAGFDKRPQAAQIVVAQRRRPEGRGAQPRIILPGTPSADVRHAASCHRHDGHGSPLSAECEKPLVLGRFSPRSRPYTVDGKRLILVPTMAFMLAADNSEQAAVSRPGRVRTCNRRAAGVPCRKPGRKGIAVGRGGTSKAEGDSRRCCR